MTIHFCQKYKSVFLTKGKSFFSCLSTNPIFRWRLDNSLRYESDIVDLIEVPAMFKTAFASVPRVPFFFMLFGDRAQRESVIHDWFYRIDAIPTAERPQVDDFFLEAMKERGKGIFVRYAMYWGVRVGGWTAYQKKRVSDPL